LLILPVYAVSQLLSGSTSPRENMPDVLQLLTQYWPMTQFAEFSQNILYRGAGWGIVWPQLVAMSLTGVAFMWVAILQFRSMLSRQG
jgi:ABC-2 type transport system permease protein